MLQGLCLCGQLCDMHRTACYVHSCITPYPNTCLLSLSLPSVKSVLTYKRHFHLCERFMSLCLPLTYSVDRRCIISFTSLYKLLCPLFCSKLSRAFVVAQPSFSHSCGEILFFLEVPTPSLSRCSQMNFFLHAKNLKL